MATSNFPKLKFKKEDAAYLLSGKVKGFNRLCIQFYRRKDDTFSLVAQIVSRNRKKIDESPVIFIDPVPDFEKEKIIKIEAEVLFLQHEIKKGQLRKASKNGTEDIILTPEPLKINPDAVTYNELNPCPPNQPS
jgi:hypothetical protein